MTDPTDTWQQNYLDLQTELLESGALGDESLRGLRADPNVGETLAWVARQELRIIVVDTARGHAYPSFQFTPSGELRPQLAPHVATLQGAGYSPWLTWAWLAGGATLLSGDTPVRVMVDNPVRAARAVQRYAAEAPRLDRND